MKEHVHYVDWDLARRYLLEGMSRWPFGNIVPLVAWYKNNDKNAHPLKLTKVKNVAYKWQYFEEDDGSFGLPPGWTRHHEDRNWGEYRDEYPGILDSNTADQKYLYMHKSDAETSFFYPIPTGPGSISSSAQTQSCSQYLHFSTERAYLCMEINGSILLIICKDGRYIGYIDPTSASYDTTVIAKDTTFEMIVISEGCVPVRATRIRGATWFPELEVLNQVDDTEDYCFYNILLIERDDSNTAYRAGLGRVWKAAWELQAREKIDVILG